MDSLKLDAVELLHVRRRLTHPFHISVGAIDYREFLVLRGLSDGLVTYGEANIDARPFYTGETIQTVQYVIKEYILPEVLGRSFAGIDEARASWSNIRGHNFAKAAVEHLYWDLLGKVRGQSLHELLGASRDRVEIGTSHSIFPTTDDLVRDIATALEAGIKRIKIKIQPGWDVEPLAAIRKAFGDITLMADANAAYRLEDENLRRLDEFGLLMVEQPLADGDLVDHAELRRQISTPICLDESAHDLNFVRAAMEIGACDIINIKVGRVGGLTEAKRVHDYCKAGDMPVWCGRRTGSGITVASELAMSCLDGFVYPSDHGISLMTETLDSFVDVDQFQRDGCNVRPPDGPGIGVQVDEDKLRAITQHAELIKA